MFRFPESLGFYYSNKSFTKSFKAYKRKKHIIMSKIIYTSLDTSIKDIF